MSTAPVGRIAGSLRAPVSVPPAIPIFLSRVLDIFRETRTPVDLQAGRTGLTGLLEEESSKLDFEGIRDAFQEFKIRASEVSDLPTFTGIVREILQILRAAYPDVIPPREPAQELLTLSREKPLRRGIPAREEPTGFVRFPPWASLGELTRAEVEKWGEKAVRLGEISRAGIRVPGAVVISSEIVAALLAEEKPVIDLRVLLDRVLRGLEQTGDVRELGFKFGNNKMPLIVSVRTGGRVPGLLPTIQGVGLNDETVVSLGERLEDPVSAWRFFRRYLIQFGVHVRGIPRDKFTDIRASALSLKDFQREVRDAIKTIRRRSSNKNPFPSDPMEQLEEVVRATARAWMSAEAVAFRRNWQLPDTPPTPLIVQRQVVGLPPNSFAAVAYTRRPERFAGYMMPGAMGDQVMTGGEGEPETLDTLSLFWPGVYQDLTDAMRVAELLWGTPREMELVMERGILYLLQAGPQEMGVVAQLAASLAMFDDGLLDTREVVGRIDEAELLHTLQNPTFVRPSDLGERSLFTGKPLSGGIATGRMVFDLSSLQEVPNGGPMPIFVTRAIHPEKWDWVLERVSGIVFLEFPGAHFGPRAHLHGVPVIAFVSPSATVERGVLEAGKGPRKKTIQAGQLVSLDADRPDAFLALGVLGMNEERAIAAFARGEVGVSDIRGDRARETAMRVERYRKLKREVEERARAQGVETAAEDLLRLDRIRLVDIKERILERGDAAEWGSEGWDRTAGSETYTFGPQAAQLMELLLSDASGKVIDAFIDTNQGQHSLALGLFGTLSPERQRVFLNRYVEKALHKGISPGRESGLFLISRLIAFLARENDELPLLNEVALETLGFFIEDLYWLHNAREHPADHADAGYLGELFGRVPQLEKRQMGPLLGKLDAGRLTAILEHSSFGPEVQAWLREFIKANAQ